MNSIETEYDRISSILFDQFIVRLAETRRIAMAPSYFEPGADLVSDTYFLPSSVRTLVANDFEFPGQGTRKGLVEALVSFWSTQGDDELGTMYALLNEMAIALDLAESHQESHVDIFCYTLF